MKELKIIIKLSRLRTGDYKYRYATDRPEEKEILKRLNINMFMNPCFRNLSPIFYNLCFSFFKPTKYIIEPINGTINMIKYIILQLFMKVEDRSIYLRS